MEQIAQSDEQHSLLRGVKSFLLPLRCRTDQTNEGIHKNATVAVISCI